MKYLFFLLLVTLVSSANAQSLIPDSVRVAIRNSPDDSSKVKRLMRAATFLPYIQPDSALFYADSIIHFSERIDFAYGTALGYRLRAEAHLYKGDFPQGLYFNEKSMRLFELLKDTDNFVSAITQRASLFSELGDHQQAIATGFKSYELFSSFGDSSYSRIEEKYGSNILNKLSKTCELAKVYEAANRLDSALIYAKESLRIDQSINYGWVAPLTLLGNIYYKLNDYSSALSSYNTKARFTYRIDSAKTFIGKAAVFDKCHQSDSCELYALKALDGFERTKFSKGIMQASEMLARVYETRDPIRAIKYYEISNAVKDSLYSKEKVNQFNGMIFNNELRRLDAIAAEEAARNKYKILSLIGISFTLLVTGILLWRNSNHKKMANVPFKRKSKRWRRHGKIKINTVSTHPLRKNRLRWVSFPAGIAHEMGNPLILRIIFQK